VGEQRFDQRAVVAVKELPDDLDPEERSIAFTTAEVVYVMLQDAVDDVDYDTLSDLLRDGLERLIGQQ
jgi:hypothetical protein